MPRYKWIGQRERERESSARTQEWSEPNSMRASHLIARQRAALHCIALHCMHAHWPHDWNSETSLAVAVPAAAAVAAAAPDGRARAAHQKGKHAAVQPFMGEMQCWIRSGQGAMQCWVCICRSATSTVSAKWLVRPPTGRRRTSPWETAEKGVSGNAVLLHTWQAPLFSSGAACKIRDAENHAKKNHRDSIVCAETFHPAKCTNTALGKPQTSFLPKKKTKQRKTQTGKPRALKLQFLPSSRARTSRVVGWKPAFYRILSHLSSAFTRISPETSQIQRC